MSRYHINECELDLPLAWTDHSLNVFANTATLPATCTLIISRGLLREGEDFDEYCLRQTEQIERSASRFRQVQRMAVSVDGKAALAVDFATQRDHSSEDVQQRLVHILNKDRVLTLTLSATSDHFAEATRILADILDSLRFRSLPQETQVDPPAQENNDK